MRPASSPVNSMVVPPSKGLNDAGKASRGDALGLRADAKAVARRQLLAGREIRGPEGALENDPAMLCHGDDATGLLEMAELKLEPARDVVEGGRKPFAQGSAPGHRGHRGPRDGVDFEIAAKYRGDYESAMQASSQARMRCRGKRKCCVRLRR
jgi:hypothetical protein